MTLGKQVMIGLSVIAAIAIAVVGSVVIGFYTAVQSRDSGYREDCEAVAIPTGPSRLYAEGLLLQPEKRYWDMAALSGVSSLLIRDRLRYVEIGQPFDSSFLSLLHGQRPAHLRFYLAERGDAHCLPQAHRDENIDYPWPQGLCIAMQADSRAMARYAMSRHHFQTDHGFKAVRWAVVDRRSGEQVATRGSVGWPNNRWTSVSCASKMPHPERLKSETSIDRWVSAVNPREWSPEWALAPDAPVRRFYDSLSVDSRDGHGSLTLDTAVQTLEAVPASEDQLRIAPSRAEAELGGDGPVHAARIRGACGGGACIAVRDEDGQIYSGSLSALLAPVGQRQIVWIGEHDGRIVAATQANTSSPGDAKATFFLLEITRDGRVVQAVRVQLPWFQTIGQVTFRPLAVLRREDADWVLVEETRQGRGREDVHVEHWLTLPRSSDAEVGGTP